VEGSARAFHSGTVDVDHDAAFATLGVAALVSLMFESAAPLGAAAKAFNDTCAKAVIAVFEKTLTRPASPNIPFDWSKLFEGVKPKAEDPYATIGVTSSATREEVRKAHRDKSASVHPDKVATLAPELQKFANDLFVRVQDAYAKINLMRGWK
jgi:DnaJ-domain-containing protein 1